VQLPATIFFISLTFFCISHFYIKHCFPTVAQVLDSILLSLNAGSVFYFFTTTMQDIRQKKIAKSHAIVRYTQIKVDMLNELCRFLKKTLKSSIIREAVRDYEIINKYINPEELENFGNDLDNQLVKVMLYNFRQLKEVLSNLLVYSFVKNNEELYNRVLFLNSWINQFYHNYDLSYLEGDHYNFSKQFVRDVNDFLLGFDYYTGPKKRDDFIELIENS
jgi:hypothetical protein